MFFISHRKAISLVTPIFFAVAANSVCATPADSSAYPTRPIEFVVAYTPGSANDILVRIIAPALEQELGQTIVVVNKPGAGGTLGTGYAAKAVPDGYTVTLGSTATLAINRALFPNAGYDPLTAFKPIIPFATTPNVLVVPADSPIQSVAELRAEAKKRPLNYSSSGSGTTQHLAGVLFEQLLPSGSAQHVPFRGPAEQVAAVAGGQVDFAFVSLPSALPLISAGKVRGLGVTPSHRIDALPNVPSLAEVELKGFDRASVWFGLVAPAATPPQRIEALHAAAQRALDQPAIKEKLVKAGYTVAAPSSTESFGKHVKEQTDFWAELIAKSGARND